MSRRRLVAALALGVAAVLVAAGLGALPLARTIDWKVYDLQLRRAADPSAARHDIAVVRIDESSVRELEPFVGRWPWPRLVHAKVVDFLARGGARTIVYDVLFTEHDRRRAFDVGPETWSGEESDRAFADAVARAGNVVVLADATYEGSARQAGAEALPLPGYKLDVPLDERPSVGLRASRRSARRRPRSRRCRRAG